MAVTQADGAAIEEGAAMETPANSGRWVYPLAGTFRTATAAASIPLRGTGRHDGASFDCAPRSPSLHSGQALWWRTSPRKVRGISQDRHRGDGDRYPIRGTSRPGGLGEAAKLKQWRLTQLSGKLI
jgi:hypothetical protein